MGALVGYNYANEIESRSGALTPSGVAPKGLVSMRGNPTVVCKSCKQSLPRSSFRNRITKDGEVRGVHERCATCQDRIRRDRETQVRVVGDSVEIRLTRGRTAYVDLADLEFVRQFRWGIRGSTKYCGCSAGLLHRMLLDAPDDLQVDHKDGDGFNNRRANLRLATPSQNKGNHRQKTGVSGFWGVSLDRRRGHYEVRVANKFVGSFDDPVEAARHRDRLAIERWGEFARLNFPVTDYAQEQEGQEVAK